MHQSGISLSVYFSKKKWKSFFITFFKGMFAYNYASQSSLEYVDFFKYKVSCCCTFKVVTFLWRFMVWQQCLYILCVYFIFFYVLSVFICNIIMYFNFQKLEFHITRRKELTHHSEIHIFQTH